MVAVGLTFLSLLPLAARESAKEPLDQTGDSLEKTACRKLQEDDLPGARQAAQQCLAVRTKLLGPDHWQVKSTRYSLDAVDRMAKAPADTRRELAELGRRERALTKEGKHEEAAQVLTQVCAIRERILGAEHPGYAVSLLMLGSALGQAGKPDEAEGTFTKAAQIFKNAYGREHPRYAIALTHQAWLCERRDDIGRAESLCREAMQVQKKLLGEGHADWRLSARLLLRVLEKHAQTAAERKDVVAAKKALREVADLKTALADGEHPDAAAARRAPSDDDRRQQLFEESRRLLAAKELDEAVTTGENLLALDRQLLALAERESPDDKREVYGRRGELASTLRWLAQRYVERQDYSAAKRARKEILALVESIFAHDDWMVTNSRLDLADVERLAGLSPEQRQQLQEAQRLDGEAKELRRLERYAEAVRLLERVVPIYGEVFGKSSRAYASSLRDLAIAYEGIGEYARAESLFRQVMEIRKTILGELHPSYASP
jgi:hypothetical protein